MIRLTEKEVRERLREIARGYKLELWFQDRDISEGITLMFIDPRTNHSCKFDVVIAEIENPDESFEALKLYVRNEFRRYDYYN